MTETRIRKALRVGKADEGTRPSSFRDGAESRMTMENGGPFITVGCESEVQGGLRTACFRAVAMGEIDSGNKLDTI